MARLEEKQLTELMQLYQKGGIEAFESLYQLLRPVLVQYLLSRTLDRDWTEELLQDTFLQLHRVRGTYMPSKPVLPWVLAIARHVHLSTRRKRLRRGKHEALSPDSLPEIPVPPELERSAEEQIVRKALTRLPAEQREPLLLHHVWGLSFREIAGVLGIRRTTAKLRAHRAVKKVRMILEECTDGSSGRQPFPAKPPR